MRRTARFFVYEKFEGSIAGDKGYMTYQQACSIFGFQMSDRLEAGEIKKRFNQLVLRYHPDRGGSSEQFQLLREAHKILLTHRHDKGDATSTKTRDINFRRVNYDTVTNTIHRETAENPEYRSFSLQDIAFFIVFLSLVMSFYLYRAWRTQMHVLRSRWSYTEGRLSPEAAHHDVKAWHPWRSDHGTRDAMDDIGILQGSIKRELVEEKRLQAPTVYMPWQPGGPFAKGQRVVPEEASSTTGEER
ncbi:chaperone protein DNAJ [Trypanosoma rangeli]|uniref:Chaperone protein DNAJ n=1 Tax=Trypanosoma rangeli TaxID=5698 RepID=A0A422NVC0_TRYRA|nr:chaperone protein DNAJ [Trypanosoma rangeli]RNF09405.1 chaperone protein DNAJ [Trypanosoma rangeli]|eukprot:RNF09405.1 chaperone protein DNAJ [Trypanosoma rangeli]